MKFLTAMIVALSMCLVSPAFAGHKAPSKGSRAKLNVPTGIYSKGCTFYRLVNNRVQPVCDPNSIKNLARDRTSPESYTNAFNIGSGGGD